MTADPAIAAAQRVWASAPKRRTGWDEWQNNPFGQLSIQSAREALAPLRANHQKVQRPDGSYRCTSCRDAYGAHADWPTGTDRLLYSEDEL
ncbi:hypothetical protein [Gordonia rubripertincta]|uniref:hypothetical protein n=1 Tax=Gordonia rubripertincta TaxID=36822 RepID=UPI0015FCA200|nr:hypothetical protein [Gordonia rubripertincta]QMU23438.1 hypothetical protein H3V45_14615 [Gordonia rubripertincta]